MAELTDTALIVIGLLILLCIFAALRVITTLRQNAKPAKTVPPNAIVVDGSNALHWGGDASRLVLRRVIEALKAKGFSPIVVFDANVGYKIGNRYLDDAPMARIIDVPVDQVRVVEKGQIADEIILQFASEKGLRVVSNDRFRDWSVEFPMVKQKGRLVKGRWQSGSVIFRNLDR